MLRCNTQHIGSFLAVIIFHFRRLCIKAARHNQQAQARFEKKILSRRSILAEEQRDVKDLRS